MSFNLPIENRVQIGHHVVPDILNLLSHFFRLISMETLVVLPLPIDDRNNMDTKDEYFLNYPPDAYLYSVVKSRDSAHRGADDDAASDF
jgi:hypothetical protein